MITFKKDGIEYRCFNHLYAASRCGKVLRKLAPFTPTKHPGGYLSLGRYLMHRVVATCWLPNESGAKHVHHKNGIKTDNRADNLEWVTPKEHLARHPEVGHHKCSPDAREKIRQSRLGKKASEETKAKQRASLQGRKRPFLHRAPHTEEWKQALSETHHHNQACRVFGVTYRSFAEASRATGIHRFTLRKRCLSKNFPDFELTT